MDSNLHVLEPTTFNDPNDMSSSDLALALYHIGAKTILSDTFTSGFINKVILRASQLISTRAELVELPTRTTKQADDIYEDLKRDQPITDKHIFTTLSDMMIGDRYRCTIADDWLEPTELIFQLRYGDVEVDSVQYGDDYIYPDW